MQEVYHERRQVKQLIRERLAEIAVRWSEFCHAELMDNFQRQNSRKEFSQQSEPALPPATAGISLRSWVRPELQQDPDL